MWLKIDREEKIWRTYTADALGMLIRGTYGGEAKEFPLYSDFFDNSTNADNRTAEEIKNDLLKWLTEGEKQ